MPCTELEFSIPLRQLIQDPCKIYNDDWIYQSCLPACLLFTLDGEYLGAALCLRSLAHVYLVYLWQNSISSFCWTHELQNQLFTWMQISCTIYKHRLEKFRRLQTYSRCGRIVFIILNCRFLF